MLRLRASSSMIWSAGCTRERTGRLSWRRRWTRWRPTRRRETSSSPARQSRHCTARPHGGSRPSEDVTAVTLDVLKRHLPTVELRREDIASCIRVARGKKIICKFFRTGPLTPRYRLYDSRFSLKDSRPEDRLYISENLSKARFDIFQKLLQEKRAKNVHSVFSKNGAVFCRVAMHGRKIRVSHTQQIPEVLRG